MSLRNFFRLLRHGSPPDGRGVDTSAVEAVKDSTHIGGYFGSSTSPVYELAEEGHKNYAKSFKKKD